MEIFNGTATSVNLSEEAYSRIIQYVGDLSFLLIFMAVELAFIFGVLLFVVFRMR